MGTIKNPKEIYQELGRLIWSIFPEDGLEAYFYCQVFSSDSDYKFNWLDREGNESKYDFEQHPTDVLYLISVQLRELQQHSVFERERWTHCKVTLTDDGQINLKFAYIDKNDSWSGLYMRGISSLAKDELETFSVPNDVWEECQHTA
ncbi:DUF600 family protein [Vibrio sp. RE86]|uniref:immunity protein YezG family protein n=1 Tax=Vibrio sp. RE86 TaxID=2607605 RepID=UPI0014932A06|nr:immunity protein YezG family protein [Vibrio sp. RE86]NOH82115.1 DUF600 family protein [Vibrio sp. RE86]